MLACDHSTMYLLLFVQHEVSGMRCAVRRMRQIMTDEVWSNTSSSTYADVLWHMLMYAEVCWGMLAGLCLLDRSFAAVTVCPSPMEELECTCFSSWQRKNRCVVFVVAEEKQVRPSTFPATSPDEAVLSWKFWAAVLRPVKRPITTTLKNSFHIKCKIRSARFWVSKVCKRHILRSSDPSFLKIWGDFKEISSDTTRFRVSSCKIVICSDFFSSRNFSTGVVTL